MKNRAACIQIRGDWAEFRETACTMPLAPMVSEGSPADVRCFSDPRGVGVF